ncbi:MAG: BtpA/SgcQ family protein [Myxococcales bacterium]|nr:BtpA/SgcQ family protein [Myxococcales bacterium]
MSPFQFIGVLHLLPLPAAPRGSQGLSVVRERALADAAALAEGGADGAMLENFGDAPFAAGAVDPHVIAMMAVLAAEVRARHPSLGLGINVLRNDARASLGVAAAVGAEWVRINVLAGAAVTDQGLIQADAHQWLRYRRELGITAQFLADVHVKHARPLAGGPIGEAAADLWRRAGADVLIVTGRATGAEVDGAELAAVRDAVPEAEIWLGSGVTQASARGWRDRVGGVIVGTALHVEGDIRAPLDPVRVARMAEAFRG